MSSASPSSQGATTDPSLTASAVRSAFIRFFEERGHTFVPSSTTCPMNDPSLRDTFANAGMNQFKPIFQGTLPPGSPLQGLKRAVNSQKCIRAGGKHNDLDDVGKDTYHHTFFEMLGNWSFGNYFKEEAIGWSFELLTRVWGIDPDRLYATYFEGNPDQDLPADLETKAIWAKYLPEDHILPGNMKDNFWEMGDTGPCGPCSEIHYDRIGGRNAADLVNQDDPDVLEIWNNVFIQFDRLEDGSLKPLPAKHVDTGMGLERIVSVLQDKRSNYDTDVFTPIFDAVRELTGARPYSGKVGADDTDGVDEAYRVIADHIRTLVIAITDGQLPGNESRGYVLRRILRRAVRYGRQKLNAPEGFFAALVPTVVDSLGDAFPELKENPTRVQAVIAEEEESFGKTLDRGIKMFKDIATVAGRDAMTKSVSEGNGDADKFAIEYLHKQKELGPELFYGPDDVDWREYKGLYRPVISGDDAFKLYDTYGFPVDLTQIMAEERGLKVDLAGFERAMEEAKERSRQGGRKDEGGTRIELRAEQIAKLQHLHIKPTNDEAKFEGRDIKGTIKAIWNGKNFDEHADNITAGMKPVGIILDKTNFYSEMGGQVADLGEMHLLGGSAIFKIEDTQSFGGYVVHIGRVTRGKLRVGDDVMCHINNQRRGRVASNHTMTHVLNFALRQVLGGEIDQRGSLVNDEKLRFDFTHGQPVTAEEIERVEAIVNHQIEQDLTVYAQAAPLAIAQSIRGLRAVFGEAYPDPVRVVSIGIEVEQLLGNPENDAWTAASIEFCGGTHLESTSQAKRFALLSEEGIAKGIRRITAITGDDALEAHAQGDEIEKHVDALGTMPAQRLAERHAELVRLVDEQTIPAPRKNAIRARLAGVQKQLKELGKAAAAEKAKQAQSLAAGIAKTAAGSAEEVVIASLELGSDRKALEAAMGAIAGACPSKAVMLLSPDQDAGRVSVMAAVPKALVEQGLKAGDWVREVAGIMGGKGGGRPDTAQGSGSDLGKLKEATAHARTYAFGKIS